MREVPRGADVLAGGDDREPRLSSRARVLAGAGAVLLAAGALGGSAFVERRAEQRERGEAFALADQVHLSGRLEAVFSLEPGAGRLGADVTVAARGAGGGRDRLAGVRLEGEGLQALDTSPVPARPPLPYQALPESRVRCGDVANGRIPVRASVVLTVVPASRVPHEQRLDADPAQVREAALAACDLPDPDRVPLVEAQGARDGSLLIYVETVPRSDTELQLVGLRIPGFTLASSVGLPLPHRILANTGGLYGFTPRVTDCAAARSANLTPLVLLREDGRPAARRAASTVSQPQPGGVSARQLLEQVRAAAC